MKILVMGMNYIPEKTAIGPVTAQLCEYLSQQGHQVTVITSFPHYPEWQIRDGYKGKVFMREQINSVPLYRCWVYVHGKPNPLQRVAYDSSFSFSAFAVGLLIRRVDVILAISPPLQLGLAAYMLSKLKNVPFIFYIKDLVPDLAIDLGMLKNSMLIALAYRLEKFVYGKAAAIQVISKGFAKKLYAKGVSRSKVYYIPNWIDTNFIRPMSGDKIFRQQKGLSESDFLVMYAGNIGSKQSLETLLSVADLLKNHGDVVFFIVGEGARKDALVAKANELKLKNLRFISLQPTKMLPYMFAATDLFVIAHRANVIDTCIPGKLLTYMASATPIVAGVNDRSETARAIRDAEAGLVVPPENPQALAGAILRLHGSAGLREQLGTNGRFFVAEHFEKSKILGKFENLLQGIVQSGNYG